jgi:hypothetical protein
MFGRKKQMEKVNPDVEYVKSLIQKTKYYKGEFGTISMEEDKDGVGGRYKWHLQLSSHSSKCESISRAFSAIGWTCVRAEKILVSGAHGATVFVYND